jgi:hypothetical protein
MADEEERPLFPLHAFGGGIGNTTSIAWVSERVAAVCVGRHAMMYHIESREAAFINTHPACAEAVALSIDPSGQLLAVCEKVRVDSTAADSSGACEAVVAPYRSQISIYRPKTKQCLRTCTYRHVDVKVDGAADKAPKHGSTAQMGGNRATISAGGFSFRQCAFRLVSLHIPLQCTLIVWPKEDNRCAVFVRKWMDRPRSVLIPLQRR